MSKFVTQSLSSLLIHCVSAIPASPGAYGSEGAELWETGCWKLEAGNLIPITIGIIGSWTDSKQKITCKNTKKQLTL
ncbi:MAG: hypothetical protein K9G58_05315 [Bacteroidales bacterium]|nr:hypothetical protein [Bacteroidales bacterium]